MKTVAQHVLSLAETDRKVLVEAAQRLKNEPVFRLIMDGLQADALTTLAICKPDDQMAIRKWQERYQALKQIDIELEAFAVALPQERRRVV